MKILSVVTAVCVLSSSVYGQEADIASDAAKTQPLQVGVSVPDVALKDADGKSVELASLHAEHPVVLVFFRGSWCPFCTKHTQELIKSYPAIKELGAELVAISPDSAKHSKDNVTKNSIPFPVLSDSEVAASKAFGLAFEVDAQTIEKYKGYGIDLEKSSGANHHALPVPAVFIVDQVGKIAFAHSDADYRKRLDAKVILDELKKLK